MAFIIHLYANDSQNDPPVKHGEQFSLQSLYECLAEVKYRLAHRYLQLNEVRTEFILFGKRDA